MILNVVRLFWLWHEYLGSYVQEATPLSSFVFPLVLFNLLAGKWNLANSGRGARVL